MREATYGSMDKSSFHPIPQQHSPCAEGSILDELHRIDEPSRHTANHEAAQHELICHPKRRHVGRVPGGGVEAAAAQPPASDGGRGNGVQQSISNKAETRGKVLPLPTASFLSQLSRTADTNMKIWSLPIDNA